jgi:hypothetical protein
LACAQDTHEFHELSSLLLGEFALAGLIGRTIEDCEIVARRRLLDGSPHADERLSSQPGYAVDESDMPISGCHLGCGSSLG